MKAKKTWQHVTYGCLLWRMRLKDHEIGLELNILMPTHHCELQTLIVERIFIHLRATNQGYPRLENISHILTMKTSLLHL
jgi:hypothetical protein